MTSFQLLLALFGAVLFSTCAATTFFVSPTGSDMNNGTTPEAPWQTLNAAGSRISRLRSPWILLLARNQTWLNDPLAIDASLSTGLLLLGAYGDISLPQPLIIGARGAFGGAPCVTIRGLTNAAELEVNQLHVTGCSVGVSITPAPSDVAVNTRITQCAFLDLRAPFLRYSPPLVRWANAILLESGNFRNLTVRNNLAARIDTFFVSQAYVTTFTLESNTVQQCGGNCYSFGSGVELTMSNSVMLRDVSDRLFMYGTTDVIVGGLNGYNALVGNDFNSRGEYEGGPDGCAFDFETAATGFLVKGNTFYRSWGSGIMIFGHQTTSHNISVDNNVFAYNGCGQVSADHGGIAVMCPNGNVPSATLSNNIFFTCPNVPAIYVNPYVPGCASNLTMINNTFNGSLQMVPMPQVSMEPPSPDCTELSGFYRVIGVVPGYPNATIRYTLDGSRPNESSPVLIPLLGVGIPWSGPVVAINMRAFLSGMLPSVTNGVVLEVNYVMCRQAPVPNPGPNGNPVFQLRGNLDGLVQLSNSTAQVTGWVVDPMLPRGGWGPVIIQILVDYVVVAASTATVNRPDLVKAGVAPNPEHGFDIVLPSSPSALLFSAGDHVLQVLAVGSPNSAAPTPLPENFEIWVCDGKVCTN